MTADHKEDHPEDRSITSIPAAKIEKHGIKDITGLDQSNGLWDWKKHKIRIPTVSYLQRCYM